MSQSRLNISFLAIVLAMLIVVARLFYWQVIASEKLSALGESQHLSKIEIPDQRGEISTSDGFPIVTNRDTFLLFAYLPQLEKKTAEIAQLLAPIVASSLSNKESTESALPVNSDADKAVESTLETQLSRDDVLWVPLVRNADRIQKKSIEKLEIKGIGLEPSFGRNYPEASMAASLLGFVGSDTAGNPKGYFGLEGYYDLELKGRPGILLQEKDASGKPILIGRYSELDPKKGRDLVLNINRALQRIAETKLRDGLEKYGAKSGEVVILNPRTGAILAMTNQPSYDPINFQKFDEKLYKNPVISESYEPGSTFKVLTMAAALDTKTVKADTRCDICDRPVTIGSYTIRTWNNEYHPDITMREVIQYSDNIGMVFVTSQLGKEKLVEYLKRFAIGENTGIDLEEESTPELRPLEEWKDIDLATASFGQGIAVTGIQMIRAVSAIANQGIMLVPQIVQKVLGETTLEIDVGEEKRVVSKETATTVTEMMVNAVENGEAKWAKPEGFKIAGKTGTSQIPVSGYYDEDKTIASFIGFAPADDPKFVMLVKLREPESSPWGSETAAPLWFSIAKDVLFYYGIQPER